MTAQKMLTPLAFALAAILSTGAFAGPGSNGNGNTETAHMTPVTVAAAYITDKQKVDYSTVRNTGTINSANAADSILGASGNIGVNIAGGDNNQQANAAALATADANFLRGEAVASTSITQKSSYNILKNKASTNSTALYNSANYSSGNLGINMATGNFNQQKNDLAVASSQKANYATASANVKQALEGNVTNNDMSTTTSGWYNQATSVPTMNTASVAGSLNYVSGNVGANFAAGGGNQQSNTLAIAAGCSACK